MPISTDSALPENRVTISEDLRSMNVPTGEQVLGCVGDAWVRRVWFDMPRYCDGTDLSTYTLSVNYRNTDEDEDRYPVNDAVVGTETITFSWLVGAVACAAPGLTSVSIKAQKLNGDTVEHEFNSTIYYFKVLPANTTGAEPIQEYSDAFTTLMLQWQTQVDTAVAEAPKGKLIGTVDTVQTVTDAYPTTMHGATVYGKSVQDGTPTPENPVPVQVVGGNTFPLTGGALNDGGTIVVGGVTFTRDNNMITANGISTSAYQQAWLVAWSEWLTQGKTYTISKTVSNVPAGAKFYVVIYENDTPASAGQRSVANLASRDSVTFAPTKPYTHAVIVAEGNGVTWSSAKIGITLMEGSMASPYVPYGCIALQTGETVTPIDLQGHTLAGGDMLKVDSAGRVWIDKGADVKVIDGSSPIWVSSTSGAYTRFGLSNQGNAKGNLLSPTAKFKDYLPNLDAMPNGIGTGNTDNRVYFTLTASETTVAQATAYLTAHPITVYYHTLTRSTIELGTIDLPELTSPCELAIYASLDPEWVIEYTQNPTTVVHSLQSSIAPVEGSTASTNYAVGAYLMHGNQLYRVTSAIATGEAITPGSNCVACTVMGEVIRLTA